MGSKINDSLANFSFSVCPFSTDAGLRGVGKWGGAAAAAAADFSYGRGRNNLKFWLLVELEGLWLLPENSFKLAKVSIAKVAHKKYKKKK